MRSTGPLWLAVLGVVAGCKPAVKTVTVAPPTAVLATRGATVPLTAAALDAHGKPVPGAAVAWSSSAPGVAGVDGGVVVAVSSGLAELTAKVGGVAGKAQVRVTIPARLDVKPPAVVLQGVGVRAALQAQVLDDTGGVVRDQPLQWTSSDEAVLKVDQGQLMTVAPGAATVTVSGAGLSTEVPVTVTLPEFARLEVGPPAVKLGAAGETAALVAKVTNAAGQPVLGVPVQWSSSAEQVATVGPSGMLTAVKKGKAVVRATAGPLSAEVKVTVGK